MTGNFGKFRWKKQVFSPADEDKKIPSLNFNSTRGTTALIEDGLVLISASSFNVAIDSLLTVANGAFL